MTASNGIRTESKKRLAAALGVALAALLACSWALLSPARADAAGTSDGNLVIDVPTTVPCALLADGTVVSPSEWKVTTSGDAYIASASASGFPANVAWSAKTADLAAQAGSVEVSGTGDAATVAGPSDPAAAKLAQSAGFEWAFSKLDPAKNPDVIGKAANGTAVLGSVTFTFAQATLDAFAVYSADDNSLTFYKRANVPSAGGLFEGKTATEVYEGVEKASYTAADGAPWAAHAADITSVAVADAGVSPVSTAYWFKDLGLLQSADISKLDTSSVVNMNRMFNNCRSLTSLDLSSFDTHNAKNLSSMFNGCSALTTLDLSSFDTANVVGIGYMFSGCEALTSLDLTSFDTSKVKVMHAVFQGCTALTDLDLSSFDTRNVTNMDGMFEGCQALTSLDLSSFDTSNVAKMSGAFDFCNKLQGVTFGADWKWVGTDGYLPAPSSTYITDADGKWYDTDGNGYAPADIPSNKAMTYTAVAPKKAFAVYSADDNSLNFYKRSSVPGSGDAFEGKTATEVYEGVEEASYTATDGAPWSGHAADIASVTVADEGVSPVSTAYWFNGATKLSSVSLAGLDTSQTTCMDGMFHGCSSLESLDLSAMSTRRVASMTAFLGGCDSLAELSLGSEFAWVGEDCYPPTGNWKQGSTGTDYSESQIPANKTDKYTRVKTASAVYSADDQSLTFYKRFEVPAKGAQYLGKTATEVFTGFESAVNNVPWSAYRGNVKTVTVADEGIAPVSTSMWFMSMTALKSADMSKLDTSNVANMSFMFYKCNALTTLDLSSFDTRNVTNMIYMFDGCLALQKISFGADWKWVRTNGYLPTPSSAYIAGADGKWYDTDGKGYAPKDIPSNKAMTYTAVAPKKAFAVYSADDDSLTFYKRPNLPAKGAQYLGKTATEVFTGFESAVNNVPWSAYRGNVKTVTVADEGIAPVSTANWFYSFANVESINLSKLDTSNVANMSFMFYKCNTLTSLDLSSFDTRNVAIMSYMFSYCGSLTNLDLSSFDTRNVANMSYMFDGCNTLTSLDLSSFDTRNVANMSYMLHGCNTLMTLDLSSFDTSKVTTMDGMFGGCKALTALDLSSFDTSKVTTMGGLFSNCDNLTTLDLSSFNTGSVKDMNGMFFNCKALKTLNLSSFDTINVTNMSSMFTQCYNLTTLDLSSFNTGSVTDMSSMFYDCNTLTSLDVPSFDTHSVTNMSNMFRFCGSLTTLDLSSFDTSKVKNMSSMFGNCKALQEVALGVDWKWVGTNGYLPTPNSAYIAGADGKWYDVDGNSYAPEDIPSNKAMTYTAIPPKKAFAIYSADDDSLNLYKRAAVPAAGEQFEGKTATEVYEGVEKASYTAADGAPWSGHAADIASVTVADAGVSPVSTAYWFKGASKLSSVSLAGLDTSQTTCMDGMFHGCSSLESLDLSAMSTRRVASMTAFLGGCDSLAELSLGSEFAWVDDDCYPPTGDWKQGSTGSDYSESDIPTNKTDKYTRAKTAFAVYSADDQSLTFYKRPVAPAEGAQFLGKTASKVFTGFETGTYSPSSVPWAAYRSNVKAVTVVDEGIAPTSTARWFYLFTNAASFDLSKLDTRNVTDMSWMFYSCQALTALDVSSFDTGSVTSMLCMFSECVSLTSLDLSSFDTGGVTDMRSMFQDCNALIALDISSFDTGSLTNAASMFSECVSLERISLGTGFKWVGWNCYPRSGSWESSSTGKVYSEKEIPSGVADTYVFKPNTEAYAAVNAASDPVSDETAADVAKTGTVAASANKAKDESAAQKAVEGVPSLEEKASSESDAATVPEGAEKATAVKSGE